ncbi:hypothetical protein OsccyDRAFT_4213 [Leptolyngbyaceae cyanobacterium JSC-12]|nr:hypothetical protein OsccyDRAFT_4213 [Leptolyngbyaceae cyanobacterium JSC-12]
MFIIDVSLKSAPVTLSVQRKNSEDAEATYQQVLDAMRSGEAKLVELTCEHQPGKKVSVLGSEVAAVQVYEKSSTATSSGRPPGFFALTE